MTKAAIGVMALGALALAAIFLWVLANGPRMKEQAHLRTYQYQMPLPPAGTVTVERGEEVKAVATTEDAVIRGEIYYGYYCIACHGRDGAGDGPVGNSFVPAPADLRSGWILAMPDGVLLEAMVTGNGHAPVLDRLVPPEQLADIGAFVRSMGRPNADLR